MAKAPNGYRTKVTTVKRLTVGDHYPAIVDETTKIVDIQWVFGKDLILYFANDRRMLPRDKTVKILRPTKPKS